jgi:hypothetical protein
MRGAREKHPDSTASLCIKNKPTPMSSAAGQGLLKKRKICP